MNRRETANTAQTLLSFVTLSVMLSSCGDTGPKNAGVFRDESLGWSFTVPPGWVERDDAVRDAVRARGKEVLEEGLSAEVADTARPVLYLHSGDDNRFTSDSVPYDEAADGPYADIQQDSLEALVRAIEAQGIVFRHEMTAVAIDGLPFAVLRFEILAADDTTVVAVSTIFDGLVGGTSFSMSYTCRSKTKRDEIHAAILASTFDER